MTYYKPEITVPLKKFQFRFVAMALLSRILSIVIFLSDKSLRYLVSPKWRKGKDELAVRSYEEASYILRL